MVDVFSSTTVGITVLVLVGAVAVDVEADVDSGGCPGSRARSCAPDSMSGVNGSDSSIGEQAEKGESLNSSSIISWVVSSQVSILSMGFSDSVSVAAASTTTVVSGTSNSGDDSSLITMASLTLLFKLHTSDCFCCWRRVLDMRNNGERHFTCSPYSQTIFSNASSLSLLVLLSLLSLPGAVTC